VRTGPPTADLSRAIEEQRPALLLLAAQGSSDEWLHVLRVVHAHHSDLPVIVLGDCNGRGVYWKAIGAGAFDVLCRPLDMARLKGAVTRALALRSGGRPEERGATDADRMALRHLFRAAGRIAATGRAVLLRGETGAGKSFLARAIHAQSACAGGPFEVVRCASLTAGPERPTSLDEVLCRAGGGTLVLDDIEALDAGDRARLAAALTRSGGTVHDRLHRVRLIATTRRPLAELDAATRALSDLTHDMGEVVLHVPPLREHRGDIPALAHELLAEIAAGLGMSPPAIAPEAMQVLLRHHWPGNVREMKRVLTQGLLTFRGAQVRVEDVERAIEGGLWSDPGGAALTPSDRIEACVQDFIARHGGAGCHENLIALVERAALSEALRRGGGSRTRAAGVLGIPRPTLHAKLERRGVQEGGDTSPAANP
jgi:DNA-binding NtrC family response regulator